MKIYIAHNFSTRAELIRSVLPQLTAKGHEVTSRWITDPTNQIGPQWAQYDLDDVDAADAVLVFVDNAGNSPGRGKWVEFGYAIARGKRIFAMGVDDACIFIHLPSVTRIQSLAEVQ